MAYGITPYYLSQAQQDVAAANATTQNANFRQAEIAAGAPEANVAQTQANTQQALAAAEFNRVHAQQAQIENQAKFDALRSDRASINAMRVAMGQAPIKYQVPGTNETSTYIDEPAVPAQQPAAQPQQAQLEVPMQAVSQVPQGGYASGLAGSPGGASAMPVTNAVPVSKDPQVQTAYSHISAPAAPGAVNMFSDEYLDRYAKTAAVAGVNPSTINAFVTGVQKQRLELAEKVADLRKKNIDSATAERTLQADIADQVLNMVKSNDSPTIAVASAMAQNALGIDLAQPGAIRQLSALARQSKTGQEATKVEIERADKASQIERRKQETALGWASKQQKDREIAIQNSRLSLEVQREANAVVKDAAGTARIVDRSQQWLDDAAFVRDGLKQGYLTVQGNSFYLSVDKMQDGPKKAFYKQALGFKEGDKNFDVTNTLLQRIQAGATELGASDFAAGNKGAATNAKMELLSHADAGGVNITNSPAQILNALDFAETTIRGVKDSAERRLSVYNRSLGRVGVDPIIPYNETKEGKKEQAPVPTAVVNGKTYSKPAGMSDADWLAYKKEVGAK
jgi:hypothetical protein